MTALSGFPPILDTRSRILILGSFPGVASLHQGQYYAHPRNQFWRLVGAALGQADLADWDYSSRVECLLSQGVGVWDVVQHCDREGSLDSRIRAATLNPLIHTLQTQAPALQRIGFNGALAWKWGRSLSAEGYQCFQLPSSSPAAASLSFAEKLARWQLLFEDATPAL